MRILSFAFAAGVAMIVSPAFAQDVVPGVDDDYPTSPAPLSERDLDDDDDLRRMPAPAPAQPTAPPVVIAPDLDDDRRVGVLGRGAERGLFGEPISVKIGAGQGDFLGEESRAATRWGATYEARALVGSDSPIGIEAAYVGSARGIEGYGIADNAGLISNGVEGALRLAAPIVTGAVDFAPFLFGGLGWEHYTLVGEGNNTAGIQNDDSLLTVPVGVGVELGFGNFNVEARGTYKHGFDAEMFGDTNGGFLDDANMNTWNVGLAAGVAF
jgi:hypothetical protein